MTMLSQLLFSYGHGMWEVCGDVCTWNGGNGVR